MVTIRLQVCTSYECLSGNVKCIKIVFLSLQCKLKSNRYIRLEITFLCINLFRVPGILVCTWQFPSRIKIDTYVDISHQNYYLNRLICMIVTIVQVHSVRNAFHNFTQLLLAGVLWLWRQMMVKVEGGKDPGPGHLLRPWSYWATSRPRLGFKLKLSGAAALHLLTIITTRHPQFGCRYSQNLAF